MSAASGVLGSGKEGRFHERFFRDAPSLSEAIVSVATDAEQAGFAVIGVTENDLVSLKTIARRLGRSYESVRLLALGRRGPGRFPSPLSGDGWALYSWISVAAWFSGNYGTEQPVNEDDRVLAAAGYILRARALVGSRPLAQLATLVHRPPALDSTGEKE